MTCRILVLHCCWHQPQIDINPFSEEGWAFTEASLRSLCERGAARLIRLDAFGYVTKKAGSSCFMQVGNARQQGCSLSRQWLFVCRYAKSV
jgi:sucrose phosphorylase